MKKLMLSKGWVICIIAASFYGYEYLLRIVPSFINVEFMLYHNIGPTVYTFIASLYLASYTPMQLLVGVLLDKYGPKKMLTMACLLCVLGALAFTSSALVIAGIGIFVIGFGSAFAFVGVLKLATIWLPPDRLALVSGLTSGLGKTAASLSNISVSKSVTANWVTVLYLISAIGLVLAILIYFVIKDKNPDNVDKNDPQQQEPILKYLYLAIANKQIWLNGIVSSLIYLPTTIFANLWGRTYLIEVYGFTSSQAGISIALLFMGFALGAPLAGFFSDYVKRRRMPIILGSVLSFLLFSLLLMTSSASFLQVNIILFMLGLVSSSHVISFALGRELGPRYAPGTSLAVTNMLVMLCGLVLTPFSGLLLEFGVYTKGFLGNLNEYQIAMSIISVGLLIAFALSFLLKETKCELNN